MPHQDVAGGAEAKGTDTASNVDCLVTSFSGDSDLDSDLDSETKPYRSDPDRDEPVIRAVESNARLIEQLIEQVADLRGQIATDAPASDPLIAGKCQQTQCGDDQDALADPFTPDPCTSDAFNSEQIAQYEQQIAEHQDRLAQYQARFDEYGDRVAELEQQNEDLASQIANANVQQTVACADSDSNDALSWEDRKQLILQQMEDDSFDTESFMANLQLESTDQPLDPFAYVEQIHAELAWKCEELDRREEEVRELRSLLEQQPAVHDGEVAVGAAAIGQLIDADELIQEERERLQELQQQWQEKFRQGEIEASLERAKLSRERLELAQKLSEIEEQLEHTRREARHAEESGTSSRRWLAKLGLTDSGE